MKTERINPLSVDFLYELFATSMRYEAVCNVLVQYVKSEYMPDKSFQKLLLGIGNYYRNYQSPPSYAVLSQQFNGDYDAIELIDTFRECDGEKNQEVILDMLESYIKGVRLQAVYSEVGKLYNQSIQLVNIKTGNRNQCRVLAFQIFLLVLFEPFAECFSYVYKCRRFERKSG